MVLKSLEIQGFKSFPDRTSLNFGKGITAVVGPNGSGKSNISDAVRWVLGETSSKSLRGSKMEDVIFSGTSTRKALGFAQVQLTLDNTDQTLKDKGEIVTVSRRYYRSGESEYKIDGETVRARDIRELFMDTGLGSDGYSMVGQGKIDSIISQKNEDRRELFEEAAGISLFRHKRKDATRRLDQAQENLVRLLDILGELESRVEPLRKQSEKAQKFITLSDEKKTLEIGVWVNKINRFTNELREQEHKIDAANASYDICEKELKAIEEEIEEMRSAINSFVKSKGQVREGGFKEVDAGILIPVEMLAVQKKPEDVVDLGNYVKNVSVNSSSGKYPVIAKSGSKMSTVAELEQNPELSKPKISNIDYSIATRRGYIPISQEAIDDADYDVTGLIRDEINDQSRNTRNTDIATVLKSATAKSVTGLDGLKDLVNKEIKKVYPVKFIISSSLYAELDKLKDKNGRYLLQDSITSSSGKMLFGKEVIVLDDEMIAGAGELKGFVGDPKSFCTFFDRKQTSVEWVDNQIYGKLLAGVVRYDVKKTDTDAGFYITYTPGE